MIITKETRPIWLDAWTPCQVIKLSQKPRVVELVKPQGVISLARERVVRKK